MDRWMDVGGCRSRKEGRKEGERNLIEAKVEKGKCNRVSE
jgi:hypothetical protein